MVSLSLQLFYFIPLDDSLVFVMFGRIRNDWTRPGDIERDAHLENIARIAKRCPENITSVDKDVKLLFSKNLFIFLFTVVIVVTAVTVVRIFFSFLLQFFWPLYRLSIFIFQRIFCGKVAWFFFEVAWFFCWEVVAWFFLEVAWFFSRVFFTTHYYH